jgi:hypothetical protein
MRGCKLRIVLKWSKVSDELAMGHMISHAMHMHTECYVLSSLLSVVGGNTSWRIPIGHVVNNKYVLTIA